MHWFPLKCFQFNNPCLSGDSCLEGHCPGASQPKQWPSPMICLVLGVQGLLGFKVPQKMVVSTQRLRNAKAGWSTGGRTLTQPPQHQRGAHTGPKRPSKRLTAGAVSEPGASPGGARPLGEGSASAGLSAPLPQLSRMSPGAAGEGPNGCPRSPQGPPWKTSLCNELGKGTS